MSEEKKLALLIDSDNVSAKYAPFILQEAAKYGELSCRRVYGDWEKGDNGWHFPAINNAILPVQQTSYIAGKNATDFSIIIDAMDLLYSSNVDGFVLVTSDSDFTRLAIRLREAGKLVVGIGEVKTPLAFTSSCHHFSFLNQVCDAVAEYTEKDLRTAVVEYVKDGDEKGTPLTKLDNFITSRFGNVDFNRLGYNRLSGFVDSFPELKRRNTFVSVKTRTPQNNSSQRSATPASVAVTMEKVADAIKQYLSSHGAERDNMMNIERHIQSIFGKVDYSKFGTPSEPVSKRFSKFLDKVPGVVRDGTNVALAESAPKTIGLTGSPKPAALPENATNKNTADAVGGTAIGNTAKKAAAQNPPADNVEKNLTMEDFKTAVIETVAASAKLGITPARLNGQLQKKLGKNYIKQLEIEDYTTALKDISEISFNKYKLYPTEDERDNAEVLQNGSKTVAEEISTSAESQSKDDNSASDSDYVEKETDDLSFEKPELHSVKRFILTVIAGKENGIVLPELGKMLSQKFGKEYLKELGLRTLKQLIANMTGLDVNDNRITISDEFIQRTDAIEKYVYDFARSDGSHSIKALSGKIKKEFVGFDYTDYGYARFSDFINAIDGVRANGYYVESC